MSHRNAPQVSPKEVLAVRLRAQLLGSTAWAKHAPAPGGADAIAAVVRRLFAVQGQDFRAARWALRIRAASGLSALPVADDVWTAFRDGALVRSWPMRGTLHVLAAEDIGWMQRLTNARVLAGWPRRREFLGLDLDTYGRVESLTVDALRGGRSIGRNELQRVWERGGIELGKGWGYHLVWALCQTGVLVFGPPNDSGDLDLVLADEWIRTPRQLDGDEAVAELVVRYAAGRGAVSVADLSAWSGLTRTAVRQGLVAAGDAVESVDCDGVDLWAAAGSFDSMKAAGGASSDAWALPAFDEWFIGYSDRSLHVADAHAGTVMTKNGIQRPIVMRGGRIVGTWRPADAATAAVELFNGERLPAGQAAGVARQLRLFAAERGA